MKTIILVLLMMIGFPSFAYEDYDPFGGPAMQAEMDRIHAHHQQQAAQLQATVVSLLSQKLGGSVGYRKYDGSYMVCSTGSLDSCSLQDPLTSCSNPCPGGTFYVCWVNHRMLRGTPGANSVRCNSHDAKWNNRLVIKESEIGFIP